MPKSKLEYSILLSSPSDVSDERTIAEEVIVEVERIWGLQNGATLRLLSWENDVAPQFGIEPQSIINYSLGDEWDIYLGLMHARFGTATKKFGSGTEEEFERAHGLWKAAPSSRQLMFYFKKGPVDFDAIDPNQIGKVIAFKRRMSELGGLYREFDGPDGFRNLLRVHLVSILTTLHQEYKTPDNSSQSISDSLVIPSQQALAPQEQGAEGFLDLIEDSNAGMSEMGLCMSAIGDALNEGSAEIIRARAVLDQASAIGDPKGMRQAISEMSKTMQKMAKILADNRRAYSQTSKRAISAFSQAITIAKSASPEGIGEQSSLKESINSVFLSIEGFIRSIHEVELMMDKIPNIAKEFTSARLLIRTEFSTLRQELSASQSLIRELLGILNQ
jgi:hypothetical protein